MCGNYSPTNAVTQSPRKGIKQKIEHGIPCYIEDSKKAVDLHCSKPLISLIPFAPPLFSGIGALLCDNPYCFPS